MGSKRYRNKICVYCGGTSITGDHVVARTFFPESMRQGIPIVPACEACNSEKSKFENYLATVLPVAGQHPVAKGVEIETFQRRLGRNDALKKELDGGYERYHEYAPPQMYISTFRHDELVNYVALMARGLLFYHFGTVLSSKHTAEGRVLPSNQSSSWDTLYEGVADHVLTVNNTIACGAFSYRGFAVKDDLFTSIWHIRMYGGLTLGSSKDGVPSPPAPWDLTAKTCLIAMPPDTSSGSN
jgi:hypothetical protein